MDINLKINYEDVLVRLGANKYLTKVDKKTKSLILEVINLAKKLLRPKYCICFADKKIVDEKIYLDDFVISSKDIFKLLENSQKVCAFAATVGQPIDDKISYFMENGMLVKGAVLDAVGSVAVEVLADNICNDIKEKYGNTTFRFSPGYGDWGLKNQTDFLKWLGAEKTGIKLNFSFQMLPRKSVSALFGILIK